jgi:hypothetical protein
VVIGNEWVTVYRIEPHRGFAEAAAVLGADYDGFLVHDGARTWYGFLQAFTKPAWRIPSAAAGTCLRS